MKQENINWILRFGKRLFAFYLIAFLLYQFLNYFNAFFLLQIITAFLTHAIAGNFFPKIFLESIFLQNVSIAGSESVTIAVDVACTGIVPIVLFICLIFAIPKIELKKREKCLCIGVPVLFFSNILRLIALLFVGKFFGKEMFELWHFQVLKFDLMLVVLLLFAFCLHFVIGRERK